ncbi:Uncharacterized membrane protein HdeD, DUF308 family [Actinobaculum suis]|uniref:HdeD family acid-resistance protein n=1 Tax=Actinobaculum suis TaxID=1657 RepID=A0A1G7CZP5_9ACTO|nr:HdeD family acid-resistance protein [Actinobaculum suis]MDY5152804.1 HdeD family acid-resistance protein [Actinobaculum suis]SDE44924.1 Uncharacterized membrane protein HdeD, DUF308 family [Actinobaculum suis]
MNAEFPNGTPEQPERKTEYVEAEPLGRRERYENPTFLDPFEMGRQAIKHIRGGFGISGLVMLVIGLCLLFAPGRTLAFAAGLVAVGLLVGAVFRVLMGFFEKYVPGGWRVLSIIFGIMLGIAAIIMLRNLSASANVLFLIFTLGMGFSWVFEGIMALGESGFARSQGWAIAYGLISLLAGVTVLAVPAFSAASLIVFIGIMLVVSGLVSIIRAFTFGKAALHQLQEEEAR